MITDRLWGGTLVRVAFDPVVHSCHLRVVTVLDGSAHTYEIECRSVTELCFRSAIAEPWNYAEVTEAYLSTDDASGQHILALTLWSDDAGLTVKCASVEVSELSRDVTS